MAYCLSSVIGYLLGSINPAYLIGKRKGVDIRTCGSKNAGGSNTLILFGKGLGILVMALDILKGFLAAALCAALFPEAPHIKVVAGSACIIGHMLPLFLGFRGGKGLASLGGLVLALDVRLFLALAALSLLSVLISRYLFVGALFAGISVPPALVIAHGDWVGALCLLPAVFVMLLRHRENIRRFRAGEELKFTWLWNREVPACYRQQQGKRTDDRR